MAKDGRLAAEPVTLHARLKEDVQLQCPLFQRKYVWGSREINQLWDDIDTVIDGSSDRRFLGALVFADVENQTSASAGKYFVIDGQQRMTTLILSVIAMAERAAGQGEKGLKVARGLYEDYIVSRKANTENRPKLAPTIVDTCQFNEILRKVFGDKFPLDVDGAKEVGPQTGAMTQAYDLIKKKVWSRTEPVELEDDNESFILGALAGVMASVLDNLEFVEILLGDELDPNEVFDRLNEKGKRLGIVDLVRNEVLKRLSDDPKKAVQLHTMEWLPFEESFGENDASLGGYFYPFALTLDNKVTKATTFAMLTRRWNQKFKDAGLSSEDELRSIMDEMKLHVVSYNAISRGRTDQIDVDVAPYIERLNSLNCPTSVYPYVMQLLTAQSLQKAEIGDVQDCLRIIESFLVRRALRGVEPTGLHAIFKGMWEAAGSDPRLVRKAITSRTVVFPNDGELREAIETWPVYSRKVLKYAMAEYERELQTVDVMAELPNITVDHLLPQSHKGTWAKVVSKDDFERLVDTWGNLVPLSGPANSAKNAKSWEEARKLLQSETVFSSTKQVYTHNEEWNASTIEARSQAIAAWATERWPSFEELKTDALV